MPTQCNSDVKLLAQAENVEHHMHEDCQVAKDDLRYKVAVVFWVDAVANPGTVVVEIVYAPVAGVAVLASLRDETTAYVTV